MHCSVLSENSAIDGQDGVLEQVLEQVVDFAPGMLISCVPGQLAYFEREGKNERYILRRAADGID
jgi:hypothetical protein